MGNDDTKSMLMEQVRQILRREFFTALFTVGGSMITTFQESTFRQIGTSAHGGYKYLSMEEYEKIKAAV